MTTTSRAVLISDYFVLRRDGCLWRGLHTSLRPLHESEWTPQPCVRIVLSSASPRIWSFVRCPKDIRQFHLDPVNLRAYTDLHNI